MSYTENCDIFAAFHEDGFNRIIGYVRKQRPSLFNYATQYVANHPALLCEAIDVDPIVSVRQNPLVWVVDPLPVPGTHYGLDFAIQLTDLRLDFHPGQQFDLPPELKPPLAAQHLALHLKICGGIGCPPKEFVDRYIDPPATETDISLGRFAYSHPDQAGPVPVTVLPMARLHCFCLEAFAVGGMRIATYGSRHYLEPFVDGLEIVDIEPAGLESSIECYVRILLKLSVLPRLRILLNHLPLNLTQGATDLFPQPTNVVLTPAPESASLPDNPALAGDQLSAFINVEVY